MAISSVGTYFPCFYRSHLRVIDTQRCAIFRLQIANSLVRLVGTHPQQPIAHIYKSHNNIVEVEVHIQHMFDV